MEEGCYKVLHDNLSVYCGLQNSIIQYVSGAMIALNDLFEKRFRDHRHCCHRTIDLIIDRVRWTRLNT